MKKKVFNVLYVPELKILDKNMLMETENLGYFENETDATLALNLMYKVEPFLKQQLGVSLIRESSVVEQLIPEEQIIPYYKSLLDFALTNVIMQEYAKQKGFSAVEKMIENVKTTHKGMFNE